jgi:predicted ester cyclase
LCWHDPFAPPGLVGPQGVKDYLYEPWFAAFPDAQFTLEDLIAEGDKVTFRATLRGTHRGEFMGIAPTGKHVTMTAIGIGRIEEGKIAEGWQSTDVLGLLQQLGAIPQMAQGGA